MRFEAEPISEPHPPLTRSPLPIGEGQDSTVCVNPYKFPFISEIFYETDVFPLCLWLVLTKIS